MIDTSRIQLKSLMNFMKALGYEYSAHPTEKFFYTNDPNLKEIANISFNTAVKLHNGAYIDWCREEFGRPFNKFTPYQLHVALASKIIYCVKLQYSKKKRIIMTQSCMVKFISERYVKEFLGEDCV
jgi:hypothetical protein